MSEVKQPKQYVISIRRVSEFEWDAAIIVDGLMESVYKGRTLSDVVEHGTDKWAADKYSVGTRIIVETRVVRPEEVADAQNAS